MFSLTVTCSCYKEMYYIWISLDSDMSRILCARVCVLPHQARSPQWHRHPAELHTSDTRLRLHLCWTEPRCPPGGSGRGSPGDAGNQNHTQSNCHTRSPPDPHQNTLQTQNSRSTDWSSRKRWNISFLVCFSIWIICVSPVL